MVERVKRYFAKGDWVAEHLAQWITTIVIVINACLAMAIWAGGLIRFPRPSYGPLIDYTDGEIWIWGALIFATVLLMSVPFRWPNMIGLWLSMLWHFCWMSCFLIAALEYNDAVVTPIPMYGGLAMISAALLTARAIDKSKE